MGLRRRFRGAVDFLGLQWKTLLLTALVGSLVAIAATLALLQLNILAASLDRDALRANVAAAFESGALTDQTWLANDNIRGAHQFNDCLILSMALDLRETPVRRGLSPLLANSPNPCIYLREALATGQRSPITPDLYYHRYIHGNVAMASVLVSALPLATVRKGLDALMFLAVAGLIGLSLLALARTSGAHEGRHHSATLSSRASFVLLSGLVLLLCFGLPHFSMSLNHFPSDILLVGYLYLVLAFDLGRMRPWALIALHALFGVLTAYFEFLNGGIPLGVAFILIGFAALAVGPGRDKALHAAITAALAFCIGVGMAFAAKLAVTAWVFGPEILDDFFGGLAHRMGGESVGPMQMLAALAFHADTIGAGWRWLGRLALLGSLALFAAAALQLWRQRRRIAHWQQPVLLGLAFLTILVWFALFRQHAFQHSFFMVRIVIGMIISGSLLFLVAYRAEIAARMQTLARMLTGPDPAFGMAREWRSARTAAAADAALGVESANRPA